jgi:hypothetical protein
MDGFFLAIGSLKLTPLVLRLSLSVVDIISILDDSFFPCVGLGGDGGPCL